MMRYGLLFEVAILHDYFLNKGDVVYEALQDDQRPAVMRFYNVGDFIDVFPTERTRKLLAGHKMIFKNTATGFLVGVRQDPTGSANRPAIMPDADFRLTFGLRITDPRFFNYTTLAPLVTGFYRFGNNSHNLLAGGRFLSAPVPVFDAARHYEAGDVYAKAVDGTFTVFHALRDTGPSANPKTEDWQGINTDTWNANTLYAKDAIVLSNNRVYRALVERPGSDFGNHSQWLLLAVLANQYVTPQDRVVLTAGLFDLDLTGKGLTQAIVRLIRTGEDVPAIEESHVVENGELGRIQLDLRGLSAGLYRLQVMNDAGLAVAVTGFDFNLYLDAEAVREGWFGVIDVEPGDGEFALLDVAHILRSPAYTLRFLNRATRWRYFFQAPQPVGSGAEVAPEGSDNRILATPLPRPLTCFGTGLRLQADDLGTSGVSEEVLLPEPETNRIRRQDAQWWSEIHVSNLRL